MFKKMEIVGETNAFLTDLCKFLFDRSNNDKITADVVIGILGVTAGRIMSQFDEQEHARLACILNINAWQAVDDAEKGTVH
jgi:CheY-specific phosphatase CheX